MNEAWQQPVQGHNGPTITHPTVSEIEQNCLASQDDDRTGLTRRDASQGWHPPRRFHVDPAFKHAAGSVSNSWSPRVRPRAAILQRRRLTTPYTRVFTGCRASAGASAAATELSNTGAGAAWAPAGEDAIGSIAGAGFAQETAVPEAKYSLTGAGTAELTAGAATYSITGAGAAQETAGVAICSITGGAGATQETAGVATCSVGARFVAGAGAVYAWAGADTTSLSTIPLTVGNVLLRDVVLLLGSVDGLLHDELGVSLLRDGLHQVCHDAHRRVRWCEPSMPKFHHLAQAPGEPSSGSPLLRGCPRM